LLRKGKNSHLVATLEDRDSLPFPENRKRNGSEMRNRTERIDQVKVDEAASGSVDVKLGHFSKDMGKSSTG
jgi:hypothetical protein